MANQVPKLKLIRWLLQNGFVEQTGRASGQRKFTHPDKNGSITVPGYGPTDLTKRHVGIILRKLQEMGFDKGKVQTELARRGR